jgi:hypothetical protein
VRYIPRSFHDAAHPTRPPGYAKPAHDEKLEPGDAVYETTYL